MNSVVSVGFRDGLDRLPNSVRQQALRAYSLWRADAYHPSLQFKRVSQRQPVYSVRIGMAYCALGLWEGNTITWFWIGPHAEYAKFLARF